jgi:hypothetical protein
VQSERESVRARDDRSEKSPGVSRSTRAIVALDSTAHVKCFAPCVALSAVENVPAR